MKNIGKKLLDIALLLIKETYNFFRESNRSLNNMRASLAVEECVVVMSESFSGSSEEFSLKPEWDGFRGERINLQFPIWIVPLSSFFVSFYDFDFCFFYKDSVLKIEYRDNDKKIRLLEFEKRRKVVIDNYPFQFFWFESRDEALKWVQDNFFKK